MKINKLIIIGQKWLNRSRYWDGKVSIMRMNLGLANGTAGKEDFGVLGTEEVIC